jgi:putative FmdB family regulatory protein
MPIYEYACPACAKRFERLVRRFGEAVSCPSCASPDVEREFSVFAVAVSAPSPAPPGCGAGGCTMRDGGCASGPGGGGACPLPS